VVSATGVTPIDVLIDGETITALLQPGQTAAIGVTPDRVIDATGKYVVPGGVDAHTHMELPFGGTSASDTFETGTRAAAWGGTTTIIDFAVQRYGENVHESLSAWHGKAEGNCAIDYGFHQIIGGVDAESLKAMEYLVDNEGITSFKLFMAYPGVFMLDDASIFKALMRTGKNGVLMHTMYYNHEIRKVDEFRTDLSLVKEKELALATNLIEALAGEFEPEKYKDDYRDNLLKMIEAKKAGQEVVATPEPQQAKVVDILEALKASLAMAKKPAASATEPVAIDEEKPARRRAQG
jgi:dihydroorotase-like cyclic amidohydrolase